MKRAMRVENSVVVEEIETLPNGIKIITIHCDRKELEQTPKAILFEGKVYGRSGWNDYRNLAYYRSDIKLAFSIDK